jgi:23S rRNA G2445 N2-methylase RlmL
MCFKIEVEVHWYRYAVHYLHGIAADSSDIDEKSLQYAKQNVEANELRDRIKLIPTTTESFFDKIPFDDVQ